MKAPRLLLALVAALITSSPAYARDWDFGRYALGHVFLKPPAKLRKHANCSQTPDPSPCELLVEDGVWYRIEKRRVMTKWVNLPSPAMPAWIEPSDGMEACRRRLERLMKQKFWTYGDDDGRTYLETVDMQKSRLGQVYSLGVVFRGGRMVEIYQTPYPPPDD